MKFPRNVWMVLTLAVAITGIVLSNLPFMGASGSVSGAGSSVASKISWCVGASSAVAFLVLFVGSRLDRRRTRAAAPRRGVSVG